MAPCKRHGCRYEGHPAMAGYCSCDCEAVGERDEDIESLRKEVERLQSYCISWGICIECGIKDGLHDAECPTWKWKGNSE